MAGNTILSDDEDEMEVEEEEREEPEGEAIEPEDRDDDDEEDEDGDNEYVKDGFIVDDVEEEEEDEDEADSDREKQKTKRRKKRLLIFNNVILEDNGFRRSKVESKKFKRLKKARAYMDDILEDEQPKEEDDGDMGEYEDELADFIVDEEEMDEHGQPRRHRKVKKKIFRQTGGVSTMALQEFHDIFGDVDEFLMQRKIQLEQRSRHDETDEWKERDLEDEFEPIILSEKYMTKKDDRIREMDIPERMQISEKSTGPPPKIRVFLSRKSDLRSDRSKGHKKMDAYYHEDSDGIETVKVKARKAKELAKKHFKSRMIVHPCFQNITADEAMEMLSDKEPGESIIRPSSRGTSYLTLTLKIYKDVYAHKDIIEDGKENKGPGMLRLGKTLKIGEDVFEDLDEVMDRYVDPLVTHLKKMLEYRKFKEGGKAEVDESLRKEKMENPSRIGYSFGTSHEHPGMFIFTYVRSSNLHHEYIGLYPKGFKFRKKMFEDIDRLVAYFQKHINDPQDAGPSIRSVAAMVPMRSPATGGSGGWGGSSRNDYRKEKKNYYNIVLDIQQKILR
ncbi:transcription elongation factor SPT6 [Tanacetum coccineum]